MKLETKRLTEIDKEAVIELLSHPLVKKHMPLSHPQTGDKEYTHFINAKESIWKTHPFGPLAYLEKGTFIGWAGLQPDGEDVELALVLHPNYWGYGKQIYNELINDAFIKLKLPSVVIYFPPTRTSIKAILRAGFQKDGTTDFSGHHFIRYRLINQFL